jgi:hypothetical protein
MKNNSIIEKTRAALLNKSVDELQFILGRYCRPDTVLLCSKVFGIVLDKKTVEQLLEEKAFEQYILTL